ncbi:MAG: cytochrome c [Nitrospirota bacterium]
MPLFLFKTILSIVLLALTGIAVFTMFEVFGRSEKRYSVERLKRIHRINGMAYLLLFLVIAGLCLYVIAATKAEPSVRASLHGVFALAVLVILLMKISFVELYKLFYNRAAAMGMTLVVLTVLVFGTSGGYYLLIADFSRKEPVVTSRDGGRAASSSFAVAADRESIERGKRLYKKRCASCHDPRSTRTIAGPGHKGILKRPVLPSSGRPATPENIIKQLKEPWKAMPSFASLSDAQISDLIAYMNTL